MSGAFLSYSRADRALADQIIRGLRALGVVIWWDEDMRGVDWQEELERQIGELAAIVVVWTSNSSASKRVKDEARLGLDTDKLVNVIAGVLKPPFPYDRVNGLPLDDWTAHEPHHGWTRLVETIEEKLVVTGDARPGDITGALVRRENVVRLRQEAVGAARQAFERAQNRESDAAETLMAAVAAHDRAQDQLQLVAKMRDAPMILNAAQEALNAARADRAEADQAQRAAKASLSEASREVSVKEAALQRQFSEVAVPPTEPSRSPQAEVRPVELMPPPAESVPAVTRRRPTIPKSQSSGTMRHSTEPSSVSPLGGSRVRWLAAAAGVTGVAVIGSLMLAYRPNSAPISHDLLAPHNAAAAAPVVARPASSASAMQSATVIAGSWAPQGLTCEKPVRISIKDGTLAMTVSGTTSTTTIEPSSDPGLVKTTASDGGAFSFTIDEHQTLSVVGPGGPIMKLTKCVG
jgi:hypothetical protein